MLASYQPRELHYQQFDPAAMFECTKCENMFVEHQDVLDTWTLHPSLDTMSAIIRMPEARFLVSWSARVPGQVVGSREQRLMLDLILVEHGDVRWAERDNIWSCQTCDTRRRMRSPS